MKLTQPLIAAAIALGVAMPAFAADVLGTAGTAQVTDADLSAILSDAGIDTATVTPEGIDREVRNELTRRVMLNEAKKSGIERQPDVQRAMQRASENTLMTKYIASQSAPPPDYPSDADERAVYEANKAKMVQPKRVSLATIFLIGTDDATQKRAAALAADLKAHPDTFADVAAKQSQDKQTAAHGGQVGVVAYKSLDPQITKVIDPLPKGGVSGPIVEKNGVRILRVLDRSDETQATYDQVRVELAREMRQQKAHENQDAFVSKTIAQFPPSINPTAISKLAASQLPPVPK